MLSWKGLQQVDFFPPLMFNTERTGPSCQIVMSIYVLSRVHLGILLIPRVTIMHITQQETAKDFKYTLVQVNECLLYCHSTKSLQILNKVFFFCSLSRGLNRILAYITTANTK